MVVKQTAGRDSLDDFARLNDDVLFGELQSRENQLSLRDWSLITVVALMAQGLTDFFFPVSSGKCEKEWYHKNGDCRDSDGDTLQLVFTSGSRGSC